MADRWEIEWKDGIGPMLDVAALHTGMRVLDRMEQGAADMAAYARSNAPWSDRTGFARAGLYARSYMEGGEVVIELGHSVDYGVWLETMQDGSFAIILPTIEAMGPEILRGAGREVLNVEGGGIW